MSRLSNSVTRSVVLCDRRGDPTGVADLVQAHEGDGKLHKAFSVFVFRNAGTEVLLQQRSRRKKLFALRWANTCCSHPASQNEALAEVAQRRLHDELGFSVPVREVGSFVYQAKDPGSGLSEYEHDTVLVGEAPSELAVEPNPTEIAAWRWVPVVDLQSDLAANAERYAPWLPMALRIALAGVAGPLDAERENG